MFHRAETPTVHTAYAEACKGYLDETWGTSVGEKGRTKWDLAPLSLRRGHGTPHSGQAGSSTAEARTSTPEGRRRLSVEAATRKGKGE